MADKIENRLQMILENQNATMVALIALLPHNHRASNLLYYHTAKVQAYLGLNEDDPYVRRPGRST